MAHDGFTNAQEALDFIFSGKAVVTLTSATTGTHFTFKLSEKDGEIFFVKHLFGPDNSWNGEWAFLGFIEADGEGVPTSTLIAGRKGKPDAPSFKALSWALAHLNRGNIPAELTIQHNDACGKCGRELTDPISVAAAREFSRAVNELSFDSDAFAKELRSDHRSIQQNVGRVVFELLSQWAQDYETGNYDLRNEDTVRAAYEIFDKTN